MLMQEEKVRNVSKSIKENVNVNILSLWKPEWMVLLRMVKLYQWLDSEEEDGYGMCAWAWDCLCMCQLVSDAGCSLSNIHRTCQIWQIIDNCDWVGPWLWIVSLIFSLGSCDVYFYIVISISRMLLGVCLYCYIVNKMLINGSTLYKAELSTEHNIWRWWF